MKMFLRNEIRLHGKFKTYATLAMGAIGTFCFVAIIYCAFLIVAYLSTGA